MASSPFPIGLSLLWLLFGSLYLRQFSIVSVAQEPLKIVRGLYKEFFIKAVFFLLSGFLGSLIIAPKNSLIFIAGLVTMNSVFLIYRIYKL